METATQPTESSKKQKQHSEEVPATRGRRVEDELRLRELELQTNFQIQTLTESLNLLKSDFTSWRDSLNDQLNRVKIEVDGLKTRLTVVIVLVTLQLAGAPGVLTKLMGGGV